MFPDATAIFLDISPHTGRLLTETFRRLVLDELVKAKAEVKRLKKLKGKEGKTRILTRTIIK